jgi:rsbT co-antagonist protein RsbR
LNTTVRELRTTLHRLEQIFQANPLAMIEADDTGTIVAWNPAAERIFGWAPHEAVGKNALELLVPGLARDHVQGVVSALLSGQVANSINENLTKDGRIITCQWHNAVLKDETGKVLGWLSQTEDISEQLQANKQLQQSEAYLKTIFGAMNDIVLVLDADGVYRDVAPTQPELRYGHSTRLLGRKIADIVSADVAAEFVHVIRAVLADGQPRQHLYSFAGPEGEQAFNATVSRLTEDSVLWVARDITAQQRTEAEVVTLQEQIIEAQQAALRELSTPIIPITDGVIAMPLIGSIDSNRAQQVLEALLTGVAEQGARAAILDITGVQVVDTQVANALLRAAQAVKLLGAHVIITGIRPEVAQTLVGLGLDLSAITTLATLQSGIAWALARR